MYNKTTTFLLLLAAAAWCAPAAPADQAATDKTLVAWVTLDNLTQRAGSALTVQVGEEFDAIVFGERAPGKWMAGSHAFQRTEGNQEKNPTETADARTLVQMAVVYRGDRIAIYRDGQQVTEYAARNIELLDREESMVVFGARHLGQRDNSRLAGTIDDARIYARALTSDQLQTLRPNQPSDIEPYAWWDFEGGEVVDRMGRLKHSKLAAGAKLAAGRLVLAGDALLVCARTEAPANRAEQPGALPPVPYIEETPAMPLTPPETWLTYHLAHPGPGAAVPGDPNPAFYYKGRYHLHYICNLKSGGCAYAHVSSTDMVHWRWHPTRLVPQFTGHGMFSGTGFFTKERRPAMIYHGQGSGRNWLMFAVDDHLDQWTQPVPVTVKTPAGEAALMRHWDPDCWVMDGAYYAISGGANPPLMKSPDLENWVHLGPLFHDDTPWDKLGVARDTDVSCANMFQLGNRWMLLCICHGLGARYYLGDFRDGQYLPDRHVLLNWARWDCFAPESLLTPDGRRVMWAWCTPWVNNMQRAGRARNFDHLLNPAVFQQGIQSLPRELSLPEDGVVRIRPLRELEALRYDEKRETDITVRGDTIRLLDGIAGDALELEVVIAAPTAGEFGIHVLCDEKGEHGFPIASGAGKTRLKVGYAEPPFALEEGEDLTLRIFIDKSMIEAFANDRQAAVAWHEYRPEHLHVSLFAKGGDVKFRRVTAWRLKTIYEGRSVFAGP